MVDRGAWRATVPGSQSHNLRTEQQSHTETGFFSCSPCWQVKFFSPSLDSKLSWGASLVAQLVKNPPAMQKTWVWSLSWGDPLEKRMATHSSILAWRIPWLVQSLGLQRVTRDFHFLFFCKDSFFMAQFSLLFLSLVIVIKTLKLLWWSSG